MTGSMSVRGFALRRLVAVLLLFGCALAGRAQSPAATERPGSPSSPIVTVGVFARHPTELPDQLSAFEREPQVVTVNGSGFFVTAEGHVITALHVLRLVESLRDQITAPVKKIVIGIPGEKGFTAREVAVVATDEANDLALLKVTGPVSVRPVGFASAKPLDATSVEAAGYPSSYGGSSLITASGLIANFWSMDDGRLVKDSSQTRQLAVKGAKDLYFAEMRTEPGESGGPVYLTENGAVAGVVRGYIEDPGLAVFTPARYVIELLKRNHLPYEDVSAPEPAQ